MSDTIIIKLFWDFTLNKTNKNYRKFNQRIRFNKYPCIVNYLLNRFVDSKSIIETIQRLVFHIYERPICPVCGKETIFLGKPNSKGIFTNFCSNSCANKYNNKISQQTKLIKYSSVNNVEKMLNTKKERYGNAHYNGNREIAKSKMNYNDVVKKTQNTKLERYGDSHYNGNREIAKSKMNYNIVSEKVKQTKLEQYGDAHYNGNREIAKSKINYNIVSEKVKQTKLERYSNEHYNNMEKTKQTCLEKYGVEYAIIAEQTKEKIIQTCLKKYNNSIYFNSNDFKYKTVNTCLSKYGESIYINSDDFHIKTTNTLLEKYGVDNPFKLKCVQNKIIETKRKNGTFNKSKPEDTCYELLKEKYTDVVRQYQDERYQFNCDFYVPSLDLFIEYQGSWTHGGKPFEGTEEDLQKLQYWCEKNTKYYDNAIDTWCIRDVKKRNTAKENKLNYIEIWYLNELQSYISKNML